MATKLFVVCESQCRDTNSREYFTILLEDVKEMQQLRSQINEDNSDEFDQFLDEKYGTNFNVIDLLSSIVINPFIKVENDDYVQQIHETGRFHIELEETWFGVGTTKDLAIQAFTEIDVGSVDWSEDEE